jgi:hypothetical protein
MLLNGSMAPGLAFMNPTVLDGERCTWRIVMPLGRRDFFDNREPCPTRTKPGDAHCRFCGNNLDGMGKCHGSVPSIPPEDQDYSLVRLAGTAGQGSTYLAGRGDGSDTGALVFWDDSGLGDSVSYWVSDGGRIITTGYDCSEDTVNTFPAVYIEKEAEFCTTYFTQEWTETRRYKFHIENGNLIQL